MGLQSAYRDAVVGTLVDHQTYDGLHPSDWRKAHDFYAVSLQCRNGNWSVAEQYKRLSKLNANDQHELDAALEKLPASK